MNTEEIYHLTTNAVTAALNVIDQHFDNATKSSANPCGDQLAYDLHTLIEQAITEHVRHTSQIVD